MTNFCFYLSPSSHEKDVYTTILDTLIYQNDKTRKKKDNLNFPKW